MSAVLKLRGKRTKFDELSVRFSSLNPGRRAHPLTFDSAQGWFFNRL
jgi:hypothetical protein